MKTRIAMVVVASLVAAMAICLQDDVLAQEATGGSNKSLPRDKDPDHLGDKQSNTVLKPSVAQWEYTSLQPNGWKSEDMDKKFNELGHQGWELAAAVFVSHSRGGETNYVFKRRK